MRVDVRGQCQLVGFHLVCAGMYLGLLVNKKRDRTITAYVVGS